MNANNNYEQLLERAQEALISRDFQLAARLFKSILKDKPTDINALQNLGMCYVKANQDKLAEEPFKTVLKLNPNNFDALLNLGGIYRRLGEYDYSVKMLEAALKQNKKTSEVNYNLGHTYKLMGHLDAAADSFLSVIEENPSDVLAYNHLGSIQASRGEHTKALQTYWRGLQIDPNHPILHYNSARSFIALKKYDEAVNSFENVFRIKPGWTEATEEYAELLIGKKNLTKAEEVLNQGLLINPKNLLLTNKLGKVYYQNGDLQKAEEAYKFVHSEDENNKKALNGLSKVYEKTENYAEASDLLKKLTKLDPNNKDAGLRYCKVLINQNKLEQAEWQLERYKAEDPDDLELLNLEAQFYIKRNQEQEEIGIYDKIRKIKSDYVDYLRDCGKQHSKMGNYEKAKLLLTRYLAFEPNDSEALQALGENAENQEKLDEALSYYQEAAVHQPKNAMLLDSLNRISAKSKLDTKSVEMVTDLINQTTQEAPAEYLQDTLKLYEQSINALEPQPNPLEEEPTLELEDRDIGFPEDDFDDFKNTLNPHFDDLLTLDMNEDINFENHDEFSIDLENAFDELDNEQSSLNDLVDRNLPLDYVPTRKSREEPINFGDFVNTDYMPMERSEDIEVIGDYNTDDEMELPITEEYEPEPIMQIRQPVQNPYSQMPARPTQIQQPLPVKMPVQPEPTPSPEQNEECEPSPEQIEEHLQSEEQVAESEPISEQIPESEPVLEEDTEPEEDLIFDEVPETFDDSIEEEELPAEDAPDESEEPADKLAEELPTEDTPEDDDWLADETPEESEEIADELAEELPTEDTPEDDDWLADETPEESEETTDESEEPANELAEDVEDNPKTIENIICNTANHLMSKMLPHNPVSAPKNTAQMISDLRAKYKSLSQEKQNELLKSLKRLKLDYVIARLNQKPGLLGAANAILETGGFKKQLPNKHVNGKGLLKAVDDYL